MENHVQDLLTSEFGADNIIPDDLFSDVAKIVVAEEPQGLFDDLLDDIPADTGKPSLTDADIEDSLEHITTCKTSEITRRESALSVSQVDSSGISKIYSESLKNSSDLQAAFITKQLENSLNLSDDCDISMILGPQAEKFVIQLIKGILNETNPIMLNEFEYYEKKSDKDLQAYIESNLELRKLKTELMEAIPRVNLNHISLMRTLKRNTAEVKRGSKLIDTLQDELRTIKNTNPVTFPEMIDIKPVPGDINHCTYVCGHCGKTVEAKNFYTVNMLKPNYLADADTSEYSAAKILAVSLRANVCPECSYKNILSKQASVAITDKVIALMKQDSFVYKERGYRRAQERAKNDVSVDEVILNGSVVKQAFDEYRDANKAEDYQFPAVESSAEEKSATPVDYDAMILKDKADMESYLDVIHGFKVTGDDKKFEVIIAYLRWLLSKLGHSNDTDFVSAVSGMLEKLPSETTELIEDYYTQDRKLIAKKLHDKCVAAQDTYQYKDCAITEYYLHKLDDVQSEKTDIVLHADDIFASLYRCNVLCYTGELKSDTALIYKLPYRDKEDYYKVYIQALIYKFLACDIMLVRGFIPGELDKMLTKRITLLNSSGTKVKLVTNTASDAFFAQDRFLEGNLMRIFSTLQTMESAEQILRVLRIPEKLFKCEGIYYSDDTRIKYIYGDLPEMYDSKDDARKCVCLAQNYEAALKVLQAHSEELDIEGVEPSDFIAIVASELRDLAPSEVQHAFKGFLATLPDDLA